MKKGPVWTEREVRDIVLAGIDRARLDSLHSMAMYSLTGKTKNNWMIAQGSSPLWPVYLDYVPTRLEIGDSRMILNSSRVLLSQFSGIVEPETQGVDKDTNALRKEIWRVRSQGDWMTDGGWDMEMAGQFTDFRELGTGCVWWDTLESAESKTEYATMRHFRATDVVYDRSVRNPVHAKWVVRRTPYTKQEAYKEFGENKVSLSQYLPGGMGSYPLEVVWLYEFFSVPFAGRRETYCSFIGGIEGGLVHVPPRTSRTPYIPCCWGVNYLPAGARWPIGGVWLQAATQALLNDLERKFRKASARQGMTGVDIRYVDGKNIEKAQTSQGWLKMNLSEMTDPDIRKAIQEIQVGAIDAGDMELYELAKRQYNEDSGLTEQMRGNVSAQERTLGEQQMAQNGAEQSQSYEKRQALSMVKRTVERGFDYMRRFDTAPLEADLDGYTVILNDPQNPQKDLKNVLRDRGDVRIDPGAVTSDNDRLKRAQRAVELSDPNLVALVGKPGGVSIEWYRDELMKTKGENDPRDYAMPEQNIANSTGIIGNLLTQMGTQASNSGQAPNVTAQAAV